MPAFLVPEGVDQIVLRFPWSSRALPCLLLLGGLLILASAFLGDFGLLERLLRGLSGATATLAFMVLLIWNLSFSVRADHDGLVSSSIFGTTRIPWSQILTLDGKKVTREEVTHFPGGFQSYSTTTTVIARYAVVRGAPGDVEIKLRDDLVPTEGRKQLIVMIRSAMAENVPPVAPSP